MTTRMHHVGEDARPGGMLSLREAARILHCSPRLVREARDAGELPVYQLGPRTQRVAWSEVVRWVRSRKVQPTSHAEARVREVLDREASSGG